MASQTTPDWTDSLRVYWSQIERFGDVPHAYSALYDKMCNEGEGCMEEVTQQLIVAMAKEIQSVQGMSEDQMLMQPASTFLLSSYYSMQLMNFPFYHVSQNEDILEPDERIELAKFTEPLEVGIRCLREWLQDKEVETLKDIKGTPKEDTYNQAFQQISDQVSKASDNIRQTVESAKNMTATMGKIGALLTCHNLIAEHSQESTRLSRQTIQFARRIIEIAQMETKTPDVLTEVRQLFTDMKNNVAKAKHILSSIKEVCPTYQYRDACTEEQIAEFRRLHTEGRANEVYTEQQITNISRSNMEKSIWMMDENCKAVIQTAQSILRM
jgi:hypothetical protein